MLPELRRRAEKGRVKKLGESRKPTFLGHILAALPPQPLGHPRAPPTLLPRASPDQSHYVDPHTEQDEAAQNQKN